MDGIPVSRRATIGVDLGDLRPRLVEVSAAAGVGPSTWIRELLRRELPVETSGAVVQKSKPEPALAAAAPSSDAVYRAWLDADLTAKLDLLTARGGLRTRAATLRALLEGVSVGDHSVSLSDAVATLGTSNHHLVAIGRNLNQIAKALNGDAGAARPPRTADLLALDEGLSAIHKHLDISAKLVAELRPMFKAKGDAA